MRTPENVQWQASSSLEMRSSRTPNRFETSLAGNSGLTPSTPIRLRADLVGDAFPQGTSRRSRVSDAPRDGGQGALGLQSRAVGSLAPVLSSDGGTIAVAACFCSSSRHTRGSL